MIIKITETTKKDIRILAVWEGVSDIVNLIDTKEKQNILNTRNNFINFISYVFKSAKSEEELKKLKKGFQMSYHSDIGKEYIGRDEKFKEIEDYYELALERLRKNNQNVQVQNNTNSNDSNKSDIYESIKNINQFMEDFIRNVKYQRLNTEDIDIRILRYIKSDPKLSLRFATMLIGNKLTNDAGKLYPGLLESIMSDPQTKTMFIYFLKQINLPIPPQLGK